MIFRNTGNSKGTVVAIKISSEMMMKLGFTRMTMRTPLILNCSFNTQLIMSRRLLRGYSIRTNISLKFYNLLISILVLNQTFTTIQILLNIEGKKRLFSVSKEASIILNNLRSLVSLAVNLMGDRAR